MDCLWVVSDQGTLGLASLTFGKEIEYAQVQYLPVVAKSQSVGVVVTHVVGVVVAQVVVSQVVVVVVAQVAGVVGVQVAGVEQVVDEEVGPTLGQR